MTIVKHITGTTAQWLANDIVPKRGELCVEETTSGAIKIKVGNGTSAFSALDYIGGIKAKGQAILDAEDWSSSAQSITITGLGADDAIMFSPANRASKTAIDGANCVVTASGSTVTFSAETVPTADITLNYVVIGG